MSVGEGKTRMFVVTIGPLNKQWGRIIKIVAIGVVLLLIALVAWRFLGRVPAEQGEAGLGQEIATFGRNFGLGLWQRFMQAVEQWLRYGF